jgi:hypothetical protein
MNNPVMFEDRSGYYLESAADIGFIAYDLYDIGMTLYNGDEVSGVQWAALGGDVIGLLVPFATGGGAAVRAAAHADDVVDAVKTVDKAVDAGKSGKARFIGDTDGKLIDTQTTPKGSYNQPDGSRTDILQDRPHFNKKTKENHGTTHTHIPYKNVDPNGNVIEGVSRKDTRTPSYYDVKNIINGTAKKK